MSRKILVAGRGDFFEVTRGLRRDIHAAQTHWRMWRDLCDAVQAHPLSWAEAAQFWEITIAAHFETALANLSRAYDYHKDALSLNAWLQTIKAHHPEIFPTPTDGGRQVDPEQLQEDIQTTAKDDGVVARLITYRDTVQAHTSIFRFAPLPTQPPGDQEITLSGDDIDALIRRASGLLNRYSLIFDNETFPAWVIGQDSYKVIFKIVEESLTKTIAERRAFADKFIG